MKKRLASRKKPKIEPRGRPPKYPMPERIDAPPERIVEVVLGAKPKKQWRYEAETGRERPRKPV